MEGTFVEEATKRIIAPFKSKPQTVSEALTVLEHIALKHIEPLIDSLREWALSEVSDEERKCATEAIKEAEKEVLTTA